MSKVVLTVKKPAMRGKTVLAFQKDLKDAFKRIGLNAPVKADGIYGAGTRSLTAALLHANGCNAATLMKDGITPELRSKIRGNKYTSAEKRLKNSKTRKAYRAKLRARWHASKPKVHAPVTRIVTDDWGYHPGVHDGVDVCTDVETVAFAMVKSKVIDVRTSGWWGKAPSGNVSKGDGIVQLEVLETVGPFKKGMHIGYGHCEKPRVKVGQIVKAGTPVANVGLAVVYHIHLMVNDGSTTRGVGNINPRPLIDYAVKNG
jgi:murein DD-endopeptidase MepM/ murein hydrolase activator NlpD